MENTQLWLSTINSWQRPLLVLVVAICAHLLVVLIRKLTTYMMSFTIEQNQRKSISILSLISSSLIFTFYFAAIGFVLSELGIPIAAYLASASIIGLAVGFGSQGLVQDVVSGLTSIFSDVYDIGDMVEIGGQVGVVRKIGLRFLELENPMGARVMVPNRSISNVVNYRRGYIRCIVDITLPSQNTDQSHDSIAERLAQLANGVYEQFPGILVTRPSVEGIKHTSAGKYYLRIKFRIWPGRGGPIEQSFKQEAAQEMSLLDDKYKEWMVTVHYEVEPKKR